MNSLPKVAVLIVDEYRNTVVREAEWERLRKGFDLVCKPMPEASPEAVADSIAGADGCITCWKTCELTTDLLDLAPNLKIIAHAAGSVKGQVCEEAWDRGITVTSAAAAIAPGVAEHTLGLMLSTMKRSYWLNDHVHNGAWREDEECLKIVEMFGIRIGVVGAGNVGQHLIRLLRNFDAEVFLYDPFFSAERAEELGVTKVDTLDELVSMVDVLSINAPELPSTRHMINANNLKLLKNGAILINTSRGSLIDEAALYEEAKTGRITVCLDVRETEPPVKDNPLSTLSNVVLTPHIAGAVTNNRFRMGWMAVTELENYFTGRKQLHPVSREDLNRMA